MSSSDEGRVRVVYDAEFEPGETGGVDGTGLAAGQRVVLVQPEHVTEEPLEWPAVVEEVGEKYGQSSARVRMALTAAGLDIEVAVSDLGEFDDIRIGDLAVTGRDGYGQPTPTVRELALILAALPERFQGLPVARYCDEGVAGISYRLHYEREEGGEWTAHVGLR